MQKTVERRVAEALDRAIRGRSGIGVKEVADTLNVATRTVERWCSDETSLTVANLIRVLSVLEQRDLGASLRLARDVFGMAGFMPYRAPHITADSDSLQVDALELCAAAGQLGATVAQADADGIRTAAEVAAIRTGTEEVIRAALEVREEVTARPTAELPLQLNETI